MPDNFEPILYLDETCPSCFRLRLFLLDSGLIGSFDQRMFRPGDDREQAIRGEFQRGGAGPAFPIAEHAPGQYLQGAEAIINHYTRARNVDLSALRLFRACDEVIMPAVRGHVGERALAIEAHEDGRTGALASSD